MRPLTFSHYKILSLLEDRAIDEEILGKSPWVDVAQQYGDTLVERGYAESRVVPIGPRLVTQYRITHRGRAYLEWKVTDGLSKRVRTASRKMG